MSKKNIYILLAVIIILIIAALIWVGPKTEVVSEQDVNEGVLQQEVVLNEGSENKKIVFNEVVELEISNKGFKPNEFTTITNTVVRLFLNSSDQKCILKFENSDLQAVVIEVDSGERSSKIFGKPLIGDYVFYCDNNKDFKGLMHVEYKTE
ncbi:cupredoxin domain-containing protein [Patescibacteria group bacterium]|nr:cupredoxin domain-containing protein [Patescibacteria group bacterium]